MIALDTVAAQLRADPSFADMAHGDKLDLAGLLLGFESEALDTPANRAGAVHLAGGSELIDMSRKASPRRMAFSETPTSFIARLLDATSWTDGELADVLDASRPSVQAWRTGRNPERFTPRQRERFIRLCDAITATIQGLRNEAAGGSTDPG